LDIELGGMRYNTSHERVVALIAQLEKDGYPLPSRNFPESNNRLFYLRGQQVWESEINAGRPLPYALSEEEKGQTADQLFDWAITNAIGPHKDWTMDQWREETAMRRYTSPSENPVKVYVDAQFQNVGFWNFLYDQLTDDGYRYVTDAGGYDSNTINWNTATAMPYVASGDYAPGARYLELIGGYHHLPVALGQAITAGGVNIASNTRLVGFTKNPDDGLLDCRFRIAGGDPGQFKTRHLVLSMPRRSLERLDPDTEFMTYLTNTGLLQSVIKEPSFKLVLLFKDRWYARVNIRGNKLQLFGPTITDMPLRMIWYFDPTANDPSTVTQPYWALLAAYADMTNEQFWGGLEQPLAPDKLEPASRPATQEMVRMALLQLQQVHGIPIPQPIAAVYQDWGLDPYGAGYHAWATGRFPWTTYGQMLQPNSSFPVCVCGEAYSIDQGWVEGALETAEDVLTRYFGLPPLVGKK
jgi:lysine 2-monooxygenase